MRTNYGRISLGLGLCFGLLCSAAAVAADTAVWCAGESLKIQPGVDPQPKNITWNGETKTVTLGSARNEYVSFQIAVKAGEGGLGKVTVVPAALSFPPAGPNEKADYVAPKIPVANIDLFVEHYLDVKVSSRGDGAHLMSQCKAGEWPTQMVPFDAKKYGAPFDVAAGRNQPVWVDIYVPENAVSGEYTGVFNVTADGKPIDAVTVKLTVWNFTLPQESHFHSFLYTGPEQLRWGFHTGDDWQSDKFKAIEDKFFQMAHQHRLNFNVSGGDAVNEAGGRYRKYYDGSAFTDRVGKGVGQNVLPLSIEAEDTKDAWQKGAQRVVDFVEKNKFKSIVFTYVWDEPHSDEDFKASQQRCKWVHEAVGKKLFTYIATPQYDKYDPGDVNIFSEPDVNDIAKVVKRGDNVWAVNGGYGAGPYVDAPGYGGRSIVWMQWKLHLDGYQFWDCCYWVDTQNRKHRKNGKSGPWVKDMTNAEINADPEKYLTKVWEDPLNFDESRKQGYRMQDAIRINGDGLLYYPGYDAGIMGPIASFALKSFRRGAQDYEYLWLLKAKGVADKDIDAVVDSVCIGAGDWNKDPEAWEAARLKLAEMLTK
ncbi:MAG TPA: glycoside hydrolase domain-containing protein [Planctomycetota bacterium]|nr:glycoside hydrolase domain-containing protein [Planctomycetota bacterium]